MYNSRTRLTDSLEREIMAYNIANHMHYRPLKAIGNFLTRVINKLNIA